MYGTGTYLDAAAKGAARPEAAIIAEAMGARLGELIAHESRTFVSSSHYLVERTSVFNACILRQSDGHIFHRRA